MFKFAFLDINFRYYNEEIITNRNILKFNAVMVEVQ